MSNFFSSLSKGFSKASSGILKPSSSALSSNSFIPIHINNPDQNKGFTTKQSVSDFGFSGPTFSSNSSSGGILGAIGQSFSALANTNPTAILNRATEGTGLPLVPNLGSVESIAKNFLSRSSFIGPRTAQDAAIEPNILNGFDNITYNFALMLAPEGDLLSTTSTPVNNLYIVAQSGVSSTFSIKSVDIQSYVGPNDRTKNTMAQMFKVQIKENLGLSLLDKIFAAGKDLGIKNVFNAPMILELTFKGYTTEGEPVEVNIAKRSWRIQLIDMPTSMDQNGSEYILSFVNANDYGFHRFSSASDIKQPINFGCETIGDFFDTLGYQLTIQDATLSSDSELTRNQYEFRVHPDMLSWIIGQAQTETNAPSMFVDVDGKRGVSLKNGDKIQDIVDMVFASTVEANKAANPKSSKGHLDQPQKGNAVSKILNISCESVILGFNEKNNEYIRKYVYYINLYDAFRALTDRPDSSGQDQRAQYLLEDALRKKYSYIFTGDNTEVLNLNIELNNLWRHATQYYTKGRHRTYNNASDFIKPEKSIDNIDDIQTASAPAAVSKSLFNAAYSAIPSNFAVNGKFTSDNDADLGTIPNIKNKTSTSDSFSGLNIKAIQKERFSALQNLPFANTTALKETLAIQDTINNIVPLENITAGIAGLTNFAKKTIDFIGPIQNRFKQPSTQFAFGNSLIETIPDDGSESILTSFFIKQADPALPINSTDETIETSKEFSRSIFGIVYNQMYSTSYSDLLEIDLEVRGDPYWLGETDTEIVKRLKSNNSRGPSDGRFANYIRGENSFFLTFKTPRNYNEETGFVDLRESTTIAGVYNIIEINHSFADGRFTQKLTAVRDLNTDQSKIKKLVG